MSLCIWIKNNALSSSVLLQMFTSDTEIDDASIFCLNVPSDPA